MSRAPASQLHELGSPWRMALLLWTHFTWRHWRQSPGQSALLTLILAVGVGAYLAIRLANAAALSGFQSFTSLVAHESDWVLSPPAGALQDAWLDELRDHPSLESLQCVPIIETTATLAPTGEALPLSSAATFQLVGIDLVGVTNLQPAENAEPETSWLNVPTTDTTPPSEASIWERLRDPSAVFITQAFARQQGLTNGSSLRIIVNDSIVALRVVGYVPEPANLPRPGPTLLVMDLPALQQLSGRQGQIDRIDVFASTPSSPQQSPAAILTILQSIGRDRWTVSTPADRKENAATMTRAFRLNLTILSLIALLVGLYMIYQALDGAVVRRRDEIAILRSLGVTERMIRQAWLVESLGLGIAGALGGIVLGWAGAQLAVRFVGRTVNALYHATSAQHASLSLLEAAIAVVLSVGAALLAGWIPARLAAATPPAQILGNARSGSPEAGLAWLRSPTLGTLLVALGILLATLPPWRMVGGVRVSIAAYAAALAWLIGAGILAGCSLSFVAHHLGRLTANAPLTRIALSHLRSPSGRHRLAAAGLVCSVAMTAGMAILVASFDTTMRLWINQTFQADLYISSAGAQSASTENRIAPSTWSRITQLPAIADFNVMHATRVRLPQGDSMLVGSDLRFARRYTGMSWVKPPSNDLVFEASTNEGLALVSESFSERFQLTRGDFIPLPTPSGKRSLQIVGVFSDYGNERGAIIVDRTHFVRWFDNHAATSLMLITHKSTSADALRDEIATRYPGLQVLTHGRLRSEVLRIFHETFSITYALEAIGIVVAVAGLGSTLASILLERRFELTTLRALGVRTTEMASGTLAEGLIITLTATGVGLVCSVALGWLLIFVINKQTFGWTLRMEIPWLQLASLALLVHITAALVAFIMGRWGARLPADREE